MSVSCASNVIRATTCRQGRRVDSIWGASATYFAVPRFPADERYQRRRQRRVLSSSSSPSSSQGDDSPSLLLDPFLTRYLSRQHIDVRWHTMIVGALEPVYGKPLTAKHLKSFGKDGLDALVQSLQQTYPLADAKLQKRRLTIRIPHHATQYTVKWREHESLLELAQRKADLLSEYMEGTCGGTMSCCSCHVYVSSEAMQQALEPPTTAELDMLDLAFHPQENSRLGCQVRLDEALLELSSSSSSSKEDNGREPGCLEVTIPADVHNVWK